MRNVFLCTVLFTAFAVPIAAQTPDPERVTVPLSDPGRPGSLQIDIVMGSIAVKGTNRKDMLIEARGNSVVRPPRRRRSPDEPPPPGLRRLTQNTPFTVEEDRNEVSVNVESATRSIDFVIEVPLRTNLEVETVMGSITVEGVEGELEIESVNGEVTLTNVGGSVVAHTVNGKLLATITRATPQQPMAFTSLNGSVDVTLPADVKANLKLRSDQGDVYTDFDLQQAVDADRNRGQRDNGRPRDDQGRRRVEIDNAIYGSINGGGPDFEMRTFNGNVYVRKGK